MSRIGKSPMSVDKVSRTTYPRVERWHFYEADGKEVPVAMRTVDRLTSRDLDTVIDQCST